MKWLDIAWAEIGVQETSGVDATPEIVAFFRDSGRPDITSDEVAWCAAFVGACLDRADIPQTIPPAEALLARSFLKVGQEIPDLRIGCIVVLSRGSNPRAGHVGFCVGMTNTHVVLLGGNQGNRVSTQNYPRSRILPGGLRWPGPVVTAKDLERQGSRIAKAGGRQTKDVAKCGAIELVPDDAVTGLSAPATTAPPADALSVPDKFPPLEDLAGSASALQSTIETLSSFGSFAASKWPWISGGLVLYWLARMAWDAWVARQARAEDASTGKTA